MSKVACEQLLSSVVVSCHLTQCQKHQLNQSLSVCLKPSAMEDANHEVDGVQQEGGEKKGKVTEQSKLNSLIAEVENRLSQALCDLPEGFEHLSSSDESSEESLSSEDEGEECEEESEEEDDRQKRIQEVLRQAETVESELISDSVILIEDEFEKVEERDEELMECGEVDEKREEEKDDTQMETEDHAPIDEAPEMEASHQETAQVEETVDEGDKLSEEVNNELSNEAAPSPAPSSAPSLKDTDNPHSVFEKPGPKSAKTANAFCSDTLDKYLEENSGLNRPTQDAITEYFEPDVDEVDGIKFMSFASREALRKHQAVHKAEVAMNSGKSKGSRRGKKTDGEATAGDDIFYKLDQGNLDNLGFNLRPHYGKFGGVRRKSCARQRAPRRSLNQSELEKQPSKGLIYGRRCNGRFASKQLVQYHESKKSGDEKGKSVRRRPCDLRFNTVAVSTSMALRAVSALQVSNSAVNCDKDGCRYGCICHLCDTYNENANLPYDPELPSPPLPKAALPPCGQSHCRLGCVCHSIHSTQPIATLRGSDCQRRSLRVTQRPSYSDLANPKSAFFQQVASKRQTATKRKSEELSYTISHPPRSSSNSPTDCQVIPEPYKTDSRELVFEEPIENAESDDSDCSVLMEADGGASRATPFQPSSKPNSSTQKPKQVSQGPVEQVIPVPVEQASQELSRGPVEKVIQGPVEKVIQAPVELVSQGSVEQVSQSPVDNDLVDQSLRVRLVLLRKQGGDDSSLSLLEVVSYSDWDEIAANLYNFLSMVLAKKLVMQSATIKDYRFTMLKARSHPITLPPSLQKRLGKTNAFPDIRILLEHNSRRKSLISPNIIPAPVCNDGEMSTTKKEPVIRPIWPKKNRNPITVLQKVQRYVTPNLIFEMGSSEKPTSMNQPVGTRVIIQSGSIHSMQKPLTSEEVIELSSEEEDAVDITTFDLRGLTAARELRKKLGVPAPYINKRKEKLKPRSDEKAVFKTVIRGKEVDDCVTVEEVEMEEMRKAKKTSRERKRRFYISEHFETLAKLTHPYPREKVSKASILTETLDHIKFLETTHKTLSQAQQALITRNKKLKAIIAELEGGKQEQKYDMYAGPSLAMEFFQFQKAYCAEDSRERSESPHIASPVQSQRGCYPPWKRSLLQPKQHTAKVMKKKCSRSSSLEMDISSMIDNVMEPSMPSPEHSVKSESSIPSPIYESAPPSPIIHIKEESDLESHPMPSPPSSISDQISKNLTEIPVKSEPDCIPEPECEGKSESISDINGVKIDSSTDTQNVLKVVEYKSKEGQTFQIMLKEDEVTSESSDNDSQGEEEHSYAAVKATNYQVPVVLPKIGGS